MEESGRGIVSDNYIRYRDTLVRQGGERRIAERIQHFVITKKQALA
ncbi:MAG: hypothetical protein KH696_04365 [Sutterella sp.]|nr:hypothetical protein [Dakarella massiliensis]MBS6156422.1 hypothetical protein [Sutterella sp.]